MITKANSRKSRTIINTLFGLINRLCNVILSFALRTVFIKTLGIDYTGVSALFTDILTVLSFAELGIGTAIATALYSPLHDRNEEQIRKIMAFYKVAYRYIAVFVLVVGVIVTPFLKYLINDVPNITEDIHVIFLFYIVKSAASYLLIYKTTLLIADQRQFQIKGIETLCTMIRYGIEAVVLLVCKKYILYLVMEVLFTIGQNIIVTKRAERQYPFAFLPTQEKLSREEKIKLFKDVKGLAMYKISGTVGNSVDNVLVSSFISTALVGYLSNYTLIRKQLEQLLNQFFQALTPSVGSLVAEKNPQKQQIVFNRVYYLTFLIVNFCSCALFLLVNPLVTLWLGADYCLSVSICFIISFDFFLYMLLQTIASFRTANGLFIRGQYRPMITAIMNIVLSIIFIQKWGIFGTILATSVCRILTQWYDPYILFKYAFKTEFRQYYAKYWLYIFTFVANAGVLYYLSTLFDANNQIISLVLKVVCCLLVPNIIAVLLTIKTEEFSYFFSVSKKKIRKIMRHVQK